MQRPPDAKRTHVEPAWAHIPESSVRGRKEPLTVPYHSHTSGLSEQMAADTQAETALDLMQRLGIDCDNLGHHTHGPHFPAVAEGSVNPMRAVDWPPHHHHDLRCLVEAGANQWRPSLKRAEERVSILQRSNDYYRHSNETLRLEKAQAQASARAAKSHVEEMVAFMESMPAVGPWATVFDQYNAWLDERHEEEAASG